MLVFWHNFPEKLKGVVTCWHFTHGERYVQMAMEMVD